MDREILIGISRIPHAFFYTLRDAFNPRLLPYGH